MYLGPSLKYPRVFNGERHRVILRGEPAGEAIQTRVWRGYLMAFCPWVSGWLPVWRHRGREAEHVPGGIWSAHLLPFPRDAPLAEDRNYRKLKSEDATTGPERHRYPRWRGVAAASHRVRPTDGFLGIQAPKRPRNQRTRAGGHGPPERSSSSDSDLSDRSWDSAVSAHSSEDFAFYLDREGFRSACQRTDRAHISHLPDRQRKAKRVPDTAQDPRDLDQVPIIVRGEKGERTIGSNWAPAHLHVWKFRPDARVGGKYTPCAWICASTSRAGSATGSSTAPARARGNTGTSARAGAVTGASSARAGTPSSSAGGGGSTAADASSASNGTACPIKGWPTTKVPPPRTRPGHRPRTMLGRMGGQTHLGMSTAAPQLRLRGPQAPTAPPLPYVT